MMDQEPHSSSPAPLTHPEFTSVHAWLWLSGAFLTLVFTASVLYQLRPNMTEDLVTLGALSAVVFLFVSALLLGKYPGGSRLSDSLGTRKTHGLLTPLGLLIGVSIQVPADRLRQLVEHFFPVPEKEAVARAALLTADSPVHAVALVLVAAVLVPWAEEVFFRGAVFGALRRSGRSAAWAAFVTSIGFTLSHFDQRMWLPIVFVALVLGFVRAASGSLWPSLALHVGFNSVTIVGSVSGLFRAQEGVEMSPRVELGWSSVLVVSLLLFIHAARSPRAAACRREEEIVHGE